MDVLKRLRLQLPPDHRRYLVDQIMPILFALPSMSFTCPFPRDSERSWCCTITTCNSVRLSSPSRGCAMLLVKLLAVLTIFEVTFTSASSARSRCARVRMPTDSDRIEDS